MVAHVLERLAPQVDDILINANQHAAEYAAFGHRVIADTIGGFAGPLAGLQVGLANATPRAGRDRALRFAVPARRPGGAARGGARGRRMPSSPSRARSISRTRCSRWCAARCCRI